LVKGLTSEAYNDLTSLSKCQHLLWLLGLVIPQSAFWIGEIKLSFLFSRESEIFALQQGPRSQGLDRWIVRQEKTFPHTPNVNERELERTRWFRHGLTDMMIFGYLSAILFILLHFSLFFKFDADGLFSELPITRDTQIIKYPDQRGAYPGNLRLQFVLHLLDKSGVKDQATEILPRVRYIIFTFFVLIVGFACIRVFILTRRDAFYATSIPFLPLPSFPCCQIRTTIFSGNRCG